MTIDAINDAHCHFFSTAFFSALARQAAAVRDAGAAPADGEADAHARLPGLYGELHWDDPGAPEALADRWVEALDAGGVRRAALIASVPGDAASVAAAVARHPTRFVGFCMVDPSAEGAVDRARHAVAELGIRGLCLFPAMHHVPIEDDRTLRIVDVAAGTPGTAVFIHCGRLSIGVRAKLGLPSRFDLQLGDPLAVARMAASVPRVPFIVPHFGAGRLRDALTAAATASNIHLDTSSSNAWIGDTPGLTLAGVFRDALAEIGPSRLLFGTDSSFFPRGWQRPIYEAQRAALDELEVSPADAALIVGGNFDRMFPPNYNVTP